MHWLTIFLVTSFDVQVHITSEGIVRRIERGYLCQKRARILGVRMEEDAIEAKYNALQTLVSPKLSSTTLELEDSHAQLQATAQLQGGLSRRLVVGRTSWKGWMLVLWYLCVGKT